MLISIQYFRAIAALFVLLSHASHKVELESSITNLFKLGNYGVDLFFIISGFVMCFSIDGKCPNPIKFMKARFIRILPLYWILTLVALIVFLFKPEIVNSSGGDTSIIASFFLLPNGDKLLLNNGWTLSYEFYFYFIFSLCFIFKSYRLICCFFVINMLSLLGFLGFENEYLKFMTSSMLIEFSFGIVCFWLYKYDIINTNRAVCLMVISFVTLMLMLLGIINLDDFIRSIYAGIPISLFFIGAIFFDKVIPNNRALLYIGTSSYSLYLSHTFSLAAISFFLRHFQLSLNPYFSLFLMVLFSLIVSSLCYEIIEKRISGFLSSVGKAEKKQTIESC